MPHSHWKRTPVLKCNNAGRGLCTNKRRYPYDAFERGVLTNVSEFKIPASRQEDRYTDVIASLIGQREEAEHRRLNIMALAAESGDRDFLAKHAELRVQVDGYDAQIAKLKDEQKEAGVGVPIEARQKALRGLIGRLVSVEGEDLYRLRAAIAAALRGVVEVTRFDPNGDITMIMNGRAIAYKFVPDLGLFSRVDLEFVRSLNPRRLVSASLKPTARRSRSACAT